MQKNLLLGASQHNTMILFIKKIWSGLRFLAFPLVMLVYLWNIISLGIYASLRNFSVNSQFITNCTQIPETSWHTIVRCVPQESSFSCYLGTKSTWIIDLVIRSLGLGVPFFFWLLASGRYFFRFQRLKGIVSWIEKNPKFTLFPK